MPLGAQRGDTSELATIQALLYSWTLGRFRLLILSVGRLLLIFEILIRWHTRCNPRSRQPFMATIVRLLASVSTASSRKIDRPSPVFYKRHHIALTRTRCPSISAAAIQLAASRLIFPLRSSGRRLLLSSSGCSSSSVFSTTALSDVTFSCNGAGRMACKKLRDDVVQPVDFALGHIEILLQFGNVAFRVGETGIANAKLCLRLWGSRRLVWVFSTHAP